MALSATLAPWHCAHCPFQSPDWDTIHAHIERTHMTERQCSYCGRFRLVLISDPFDGLYYCVNDQECE